jgi:hypothetical protein
MFFPRIYSNNHLHEDIDSNEQDNSEVDESDSNLNSGSRNGGSNSSSAPECLGRLVIFFFGKLFVACLLSEEAIAALHVNNIKQLIEKRGKEMTCRQVKASWIPDHLDVMGKGGSQGNNNSFSANTSTSAESPVVQITQTEGVIEYPGFPADLFRIQAVYVVSKLHKILKSELDNGEGSSSSSSSGGSGKETAHTYRKDGNAMLIANTPSPSMVRASIHTKSFLEKEMKVIGFLPNGTIVRVCGADLTLAYYPVISNHEILCYFNTDVAFGSEFSSNIDVL